MLEINPNAVSVWISLQHCDCAWLSRLLLRRHTPELLRGIWLAA